MMTYTFGKTSRANLVGVHPALVLIAERAIVISPVDFGVYDGARTLAEQRANVRRGVSKTMNSKHIVQSDGYGHAVDLVPWYAKAGEPSANWHWDWDRCFVIAAAVRSVLQGEQVTWGGVWDRLLSELPGDVRGLRQAVVDYNERHPGRDFNDGPHFQLGRN